MRKSLPLLGWRLAAELFSTSRGGRCCARNGAEAAMQHAEVCEKEPGAPGPHEAAASAPSTTRRGQRGMPIALQVGPPREDFVATKPAPIPLRRHIR